MRRFTLLFGSLVLGCAALYSCSFIEDLIKIPIKVNSSFTIPAGTGIGNLVNITTSESTTNLEEELTINDTRIDRVKTVELRECVLTIISGSNEDFSFLNDIEVFLKDDELGNIKVAFSYDIPDSLGSELTLNVASDDLTEYLKKESIQYSINVTTDEILLNSIEVNVFTRFRITADLFR